MRKMGWLWWKHVEGEGAAAPQTERATLALGKHQVVPHLCLGLELWPQPLLPCHTWQQP